MVDKYSIITWLKRQWGMYKKYWKHDRLNTKVENKVGRIALQSIQTLIKMKHLQKHNDTLADCFVMDGNANNGIELDDVVLDKEDQYLVKTAFRLLKYGG
tara:strand:- start:104 stop:403 length:300 start_codon:yes stop_codon:yes gene_type:complete